MRNLRESRPQPLRTLHAVASLDERMGGSIRAPLLLADALIEGGHEATLVATYSDGDATGFLDEEFPRVDRKLFARATPKHNFRSPTLRKWLLSNVAQYDIVNIHGVFSFVTIYCAWACRQKSVPYVIHPHGSLEPFDLKKHAALKWFYNRLVVRPILRGARGLVLTTGLERERLRDFGVPIRRYVVPLPVRALNQSYPPHAFRKQHGIALDAPVILFVGRLDVKKGLQHLIPATTELRKEFPTLRLVIVGSGEAKEEERVNALVGNAGADSWIVRCGFLTGALKAAAYATADVFALPSQNENFGITVVESLQAGTPVVISNEVYIHDMLSQAGVATVCEPTTDSCRRAMALLLRDGALRTAMGSRGIAVATDLFSPRVIAHGLEGVYRAVLQERAEGGGNAGRSSCTN